ncbi:MAG: hypothetical protein ACJAWL_001493 [Motiliproteus sp.]|jgi:hypothetical protein
MIGHTAQYEPSFDANDGYFTNRHLLSAAEPIRNFPLPDLIPLWNQTSGKIIIILTPPSDIQGMGAVLLDSEREHVLTPAAVLERYGLNKTQAASIFRVTRQAIYDWVSSDGNLKPENQHRLDVVIEALSCVDASDAKALGKVLKYRVPSEKYKLQELLIGTEVKPAQFKAAYIAMKNIFSQQKALTSDKQGKKLSPSDDIKLMSV